MLAERWLCVARSQEYNRKKDDTNKLIVQLARDYGIPSFEERYAAQSMVQRERASPPPTRPVSLARVQYCAIHELSFVDTPHVLNI